MKVISEDINNQIMSHKSLKEDFNYSNEDIFSGIDEVYDKMNEVSSALYALSTYLEDYPKLMKSIDMCINYFSDWSSYFNGEAEDIKKELDPPEEDDMEESLKEQIINEAPAGKVGKQIAKMVQSGMDFDSAVEKVTSNKDISDFDLN